MLLDICKMKPKFFICVFLFFISFFFIFSKNCAYTKKQINNISNDNLSYVQIVQASTDSLRNFLILLDKSIIKENEQINNFDLDIALQQLEIINKGLLEITYEVFYYHNLIQSFFGFCNSVNNIKILKFNDKKKILEAINNIKKNYMCSKNAQFDMEQKSDFLFENIIALCDLIRSVFLMQNVKLKGLGSKIFDKFIYKPCKFIIDNKKNVVIITCAIGSLIISGALLNKFLKKEEAGSSSNNNLETEDKQDQIEHDFSRGEQKGQHEQNIPASDLLLLINDKQKDSTKHKLTSQYEFELSSKFCTQEEQDKILDIYDTSDHEKIKKIFFEKAQELKDIQDRLNENNNNNTHNKESVTETKTGRWARFKTGIKNGVKKCFSGFAVNSQQKVGTKFPGSYGIDMNLKN